MRLSIILLALMLAGCATPQHHAENAATRAALAAADEAKCAGQGLQKDTNSFAECMLQLEQARQSQQATDEAAPIALYSASGPLNVNGTYTPRTLQGVLTKDEARRIASNIAKLPTLLSKKR